HDALPIYNILDVIRTVRSIREKMIQDHKPVILELMTFRMRGHEEASGTKYYPEGLQDKWKKYDPVDNYTLYLKELGILTDALEKEIHDSIKEEIQANFDIAQNEPLITASVQKELQDVYAPFKQTVIQPTASKKEM